MGGFNGSGVYQRYYNWTQDAANGIKIRADRMDTDSNGFATGLTTCVTRDGQSPALADLPMGGFKHTGVADATTADEYATLGQVQKDTASFGILGGTADALTFMGNPTIDALIDGMQLNGRALLANLTTAPTLEVEALGSFAITKLGGEPILPGDIAGPLHELIFRYNLANTRWELLNPAVSSPPWVVATGTANAITATYAPALPALYDGLICAFRAASSITSATPSFSPSALTAHPITRDGGSSLRGTEILALGEYLVRYNLANTRWELLNPSPGAIKVLPAFIIAGVYTPTPGMVFCVVECWGPGGGAGGVAGGQVGTSGTATSVGVLVVANGGGFGGGNGGAPNGAGGTGGTGDLGIDGSSSNDYMGGGAFGFGQNVTPGTAANAPGMGGSAPAHAQGTGGGGGEYRKRVLTASQIGVSQVVTIGAKGLGYSGNGLNGFQGLCVITEYF